MSIISLKSSFSSDEISMKLNYSSFINEFKHSLTSMKSFSSLSIINLTSSSLSSHSSKLRTSLHWLVILWIQRSLFLWLLFQQYLRLFLSHFSFLNKSMNLSFIIVIIQDKTLIVFEIKKICNKWKLCYYCKLQHSSKITKECSNKKFFTLHIMNVYDSDVINIDEEVSLFAKKV